MRSRQPLERAERTYAQQPVGKLQNANACTLQSRLRLLAQNVTSEPETHLAASCALTWSATDGQMRGGMEGIAHRSAHVCVCVCVCVCVYVCVCARLGEKDSHTHTHTHTHTRPCRHARASMTEGSKPRAPARLRPVRDSASPR